jgi:transposase
VSISIPAKEADKMDKKEWVEEFRQQVRARGGVGPRTRYTPEQRQQAVEYVRERKQQGVSVEEVARQLGMSSWTLSRWSSATRRGEQEPARAALVPVEVKTARGETRAGGLVVHGPGGVRVEGVSVEDAVRLLRGLR